MMPNKLDSPATKIKGYFSVRKGLLAFPPKLAGNLPLLAAVARDAAAALRLGGRARVARLSQRASRAPPPPLCWIRAYPVRIQLQGLALVVFPGVIARYHGSLVWSFHHLRGLGAQPCCAANQLLPFAMKPVASV